jgi:hypothetical protein
MALSVLLIGGHTLTTLHTVLVPHEVCAEHGELVHVGHGGEKAKADAPPAPLGPAASQRADDEHSHDHCSLAARTGDDLAVAGGGSAELAAVAPVAPVALAPSLDAPVVPALSAAPKQSPPA